MINYLTDEINKSVPILPLLERYGIQADGKMRSICPNKEHHNKISASINSEFNSCHCFACQKTYKPVDVVMVMEAVNLPEACEILIRDFGLNRFEITKGYGQITEDGFPFTLDDLRAIGLRANDPVEDIEGSTDVYASLRSFYRENTVSFYAYVQDKISKATALLFDEKENLTEQVSKQKETIGEYCSYEKAGQLWDNYCRAREKMDAKEIEKKLTKEQKAVLSAYKKAKKAEESLSEVDERLSALLSLDGRINGIREGGFQSGDSQRIEDIDSRMEEMDGEYDLT